MYWNELKNLKNEYKKMQTKACEAKTKKTSVKYREIASGIRRQLSNELADWNFKGLDFSQFNIMAAMGGPYCLVGATNFKLEKHLGAATQVSFEYKGERFAGYIHWIDDKCGFDNMSKIV